MLSLKSSQKLKAFKELVAIKYQIYNGLFLTLPFDELENTGAHLAFLLNNLREKLEKGQTPTEIIEDFFREIRHSDIENSCQLDKKNVKTLFSILQFVERQVVLFDALEDAAFGSVNDMSGAGTVEQLINQVIDRGKEKSLKKILNNYRVRVVLTAHPTQFYPSSILGIISDLSVALQKDQINEINSLLLQMGKTKFKNREKPTPVEEAQSLIWYLERVFYKTLPLIQSNLQNFLEDMELKGPIIELGFWPGGDRDGNPFVTSETTKKVAHLLKSSLIDLYLRDIASLKKRLTFKGVDEKLLFVEQGLMSNSKAELCSINDELDIQYRNSDYLLKDLFEIRDLLVNKHQSLFLEQLDSFITKVKIFGFHFASLDLRQDSRIHNEVLSEIFSEYDYKNQTQDEKINFIKDFLSNKSINLNGLDLNKGKLSSIAQETLKSITTAREIQQSNGIKGLNRYIISNTQSAVNILEVIALAKLADWSLENLNFKIIPLFETIEDLENSELIMKSLYEDEIYSKYLKKQKQVQTIMLGFSDGTKDGGYFTANWSIFKAKQNLTEISRKYGVKVTFFDGRGGPPARGGGNTHKFYRSMGELIENDEIQLTIQGQTISSKLGTEQSAQFNLEQLFTAGIEPEIFPDDNSSLSSKEIKLFEQLSEESLKAYLGLRNHKLFTSYLEEVTPLSYYEQLNIGSRPAKRKKSQSLKFEDLRAIPFVGAWTQMKQNIAGFYGFGSAMKTLTEKGKKDELKSLFEKSLFFRTLVENAMQSLSKSFFPLTFYLKKDKKFGGFWKILYEESILTETMLKEISGQNELLEESDISRESIKMREKIVLPLLTIQHFAMDKAREIKKDPSKYPTGTLEVFEKMIIKSLAANVNASRNSV